MSAPSDIITITMGATRPEVGAVLHLWTDNKTPYTLRVISKEFDPPTGYHPQGVWWYVCERTHGVHL